MRLPGQFQAGLLLFLRKGFERKKGTKTQKKRFHAFVV